MKKLTKRIDTITKKEFNEQIRYFNSELERFRIEQETILKQYGAFRVAVRNIIKGLDTSAAELEISTGFTKGEINSMSADEYKEKVLKPLGMVRNFSR